MPLLIDIRIMGFSPILLETWGCMYLRIRVKTHVINGLLNSAINSGVSQPQTNTISNYWFTGSYGQDNGGRKHQNESNLLF